MGGVIDDALPQLGDANYHQKTTFRSKKRLATFRRFRANVPAELGDLI